MTIMKLIDKDALTAEIEKRRKEAESNCGGYKSYDEHRCDSCTVAFYNEFLEIINALEVKEVDTWHLQEKEDVDFFNNLHIDTDINMKNGDCINVTLRQIQNIYKNKLVAEIEKLKAESIQTLRNDNHKDSPEYYSAAGQASAYVKVLDLINELYDTRR